jgi:hypothetical protein
VTAARWLTGRHPVRWLRWLRAVTLTLIVAAGLLCLLVTYLAHREITSATTRGAAAVAEIDTATSELAQAQTEVTQGKTKIAEVSLNPLTGSSSTFDDAVAAATQDLVLAAENNVDGVTGADDIQFAAGLLETYSGLVQQAAIFDADPGSPILVNSEQSSASALLKQVDASLQQLRDDERQGINADLGSLWLTPGDFWWLLLAPFLALLVLGAATSYVLWRGFRRLFSVRLTAALGLTLVLVALVASLNTHDAGQARTTIGRWLAVHAHPAVLSADTGLAFSVLTLVIGLILVGLAITLTLGAYAPRLNEYRYQLRHTERP